MKKLIITAYVILSSCLMVQAQDAKFNENDFVKYINNIRKTEIVRSSDSCAPCVNELFSVLEKKDMSNSVDILFHSTKANKKYGQVFVSISTEYATNVNQYFEGIVSPVKSLILNEKNKHFLLFQKQLSDRVIIVFKVVK